MAGGERQDLASRSDASYIFPSHATEVDRLDLQHFALREAIGGNYVAPIRTPALILDVGGGTGRWAAEMAVDFPGALVVALDMRASRPHPLPNHRFVRSNVLDGLPFAADTFDFVHQRLLGPGLPLKAWAAVIQDLVRVSRPEGWLELVEGQFDLEPAGPATAQLFKFAWRLASSLGLDTTGITFGSLDEYLRRAGAVDAEQRTVEMPVGGVGREGRILHRLRLSSCVHKARRGLPGEVRRLRRGMQGAPQGRPAGVGERKEYLDGRVRSGSKTGRLTRRARANVLSTRVGRPPAAQLRSRQGSVRPSA